MTQKQIKALKQEILGLNFDAHCKRSKAVALSQKLMNAHEYAEFTKSDYRTFFKSRRIKQSWV